MSRSSEVKNTTFLYNNIHNACFSIYTTGDHNYRPFTIFITTAITKISYKYFPLRKEVECYDFRY